MDYFLGLFRCVLLLPLILLPGVWVSHTVGRGVFHEAGRWGLAMTLSPIVVGGQMLLLRSVGAPFTTSAWLVLALNLPALLLLKRRADPMKDRTDSSHWDKLILGLLTCGGILYAAYPWLTIEGYRQFSYHNLLYIDAVYALTRAQGLVPEEPQMAGYVLAYPWFSQLYTATVGGVTNIAPTFLYCLLNATQLIALTLCFYSAARDELKLGKPAAAMAMTLLYFGQNLPGTITSFFAPGGAYAWAWMLGDMRTGPFLLKFNNANAMPYGLALFAAIVLATLIARRKPGWRISVVMALLLTALGLIYPALLPPAGLLSGVVLLMWMTKAAVDQERVSGRQIAGLAILLFAAASASYIYKQIITADLQMSSIWVSTGQRMLYKSGMFIVSMILPLIPALLYLMRRVRHREWNTLLLASLVVIGVALNVVFSMGGSIEYKFLYASGFALALLAGMFVDCYITFSPRLVPVFTAIIFIALLGLYGKHSYSHQALVPQHVSHGPRLSEQSFDLSLHDSEPDAHWTNKVREVTPANSIVVTHDREHHIGTYVGRTLYAAQDHDELVRRVGYAETARYNLITLRGYPVDVFDGRLKAIEIFYKSSDDRDIAASVAEFHKLGRPVVVHFEGDCHAQDWMRRMHPSAVIFNENNHSVWLIPAAEKTP